MKFPTKQIERLPLAFRNVATTAIVPAIQTQSESLIVPIDSQGTELVCPPDLPPEAYEGRLVDRLEPWPFNLPYLLDIVRSQDGKAHSIRYDKGNLYTLPVTSKQLDNIIRNEAREENKKVSRAAILNINDILQGHAEMAGEPRDVYYRVAPIKDGVEIDRGDAAHTRFRIRPGSVEIVTSGSETLFSRNVSMLPMAMPAAVGNLDLLDKYLNLTPASVIQIKAWLSYTLAHPKVPSSKFPILLLRAGQGSGKSSLCRLVKRVIDPNAVEVQTLPKTPRDLAIDTQGAHVLCFDNIRECKPDMADKLCIAATGGALTTRQLYTDATQHVHRLHCALVLNGIHAFIEQPDLSQRCLPIDFLPMAESKRKSEVELNSELEADLPAIMRGLFDRIAEIFSHLPAAVVTHPERMIDFVHWLAASENADGVSPGTYQAMYGEALKQGQLDTLLDDSLAAALVAFAENEVTGSWTGTPTKLLAALNANLSDNTTMTKEWPQNAIALSKRLLPLQAGLASQGIRLEMQRGRERKVIISK